MMRRPSLRIARPGLLFLAIFTAAVAARSTPGTQSAAVGHGESVPALDALVARPRSELADVVTAFSVDQTTLGRRYDAVDSPDQRKRMRELYTSWRTRLAEAAFDRLQQEGRVDYV